VGLSIIWLHGSYKIYQSSGYQFPDGVYSAVKFIRDQASMNRFMQANDKGKRNWKPAQALRKMLIGEEGEKRNVRISDEPSQTKLFDPLSGWTEGVALQKSHFFVLLKPQIILRGSDPSNGVCILAAIQAQLQSYAILDTANLNDPVTGRIMARSAFKRDCVVSNTDYFAGTTPHYLDCKCSGQLNSVTPVTAFHLKF
jgi:hypothetical protein